MRWQSALPPVRKSLAGRDPALDRPGDLAVTALDKQSVVPAGGRHIAAGVIAMQRHAQAVASIALPFGRHGIGIEIDPKYFDIACRRVEAAYRQPRLFEEPAPKLTQGALL